MTPYVIFTIINFLCLVVMIYCRYFKPKACSHTYEFYERFDIIHGKSRYGAIIVSRCSKCGKMSQYKVES